MGAGFRYPSCAIRTGSSRSSAQSRRGPRSQCSIGTPKPALGRSVRLRGTWRASTSRKSHLPRPLRILMPHRQRPRELHDAVVEERNPRLQRDGHAGAVHLGQNIVREIGERVGELHALGCLPKAGRREGGRVAAGGIGLTRHKPARLGPLRDEAAIEARHRLARPGDRPACGPGPPPWPAGGMPANRTKAGRSRPEGRP